MINIKFGVLPDALQSGDGYFDNWLDEEVLETDFAKRVVREIDKSELVSKRLVQSPVLGSIPVSDISGGAKSLIILMFTDKIMELEALGDNCFPLLFEIGKQKDITLSMEAYRDLFGSGVSQVRLLNTDEVITSKEAFRTAYIKWLGE